MRLPKRILIAFDRSETSLRALDYALELAKRSGATVIVFHAFGEPIATADEVAAAEKHARFELGEILQARAAPNVEIVPRMRWIDAASGILEDGNTWADLVILGTHGRTGISRAVLGSVAETVVRRSERPVLLMRRLAPGSSPPPVHAMPQRIVVATDFQAPAKLALAEAVELAEDAGAAITLVNAFTGPAVSNAHAGLAEAIDDHASSEATIVPELRHGAPADVVNAVATDTDADLIVVGTHGRYGVERLLLGSVAEEIVRTATRPVLVFHDGRKGR